MEHNVLTQEGKEEYNKRMFTENGIKVLNNYLKQLTEFWYTKKEEDYPFKVGRIFGIPNFKFANTFKNKDEMMGRMKMLAQLIGIKDIELVVNNTTIKINLEGE